MQIEKLADALAKVQSIIQDAKKSKTNSHYKSTYADLTAVFEAIREPLSSNGLSISQVLDVSENGATHLKTVLMHVSGQYLESRIPVPSYGKAQELGSTLTYYRRYMLMAIVGIGQEEDIEDDDGEADRREAEAAERERKFQEEKARLQRELAVRPISVKEWTQLDYLLPEDSELRANIAKHVKSKYGVEIHEMPYEIYISALEKAKAQFAKAGV